MTNTSSPRTFSCTSTKISMSAKRRTMHLASGILRYAAIASASGRLLLPATSFIEPRSLSRQSLAPASLSRARRLAHLARLKGRCKLTAASACGWALVSAARLGKELNDAVGSGAGRGIGHGAPRAIQRAFGNIVLLGDGADPLDVRIEHLPVDADALFAA